MLYNIPDIISPELLKILMEMGHGDNLVISDANFPAASHTQKLLNCHGHSSTDMLQAILKLYPLDSFVQCPVSVMDGEIDGGKKPPIWNKYKKIVQEHYDQFIDFEYLDRFEFYKAAEESYAIVSTTEMQLYGCIILKKGIICTTQAAVQI